VVLANYPVDGNQGDDDATKLVVERYIVT